MDYAKHIVNTHTHTHTHTLTYTLILFMHSTHIQYTHRPTHRYTNSILLPYSACKSFVLFYVKARKADECVWVGIGEMLLANLWPSFPEESSYQMAEPLIHQLL